MQYRFRSLQQSRFIVPFCRLVLLFCAALLLVQPSHAASARHYFKQGRLAEAKDDFIAAYEGYEHAYKLKPGDMRYKEAAARLRTSAAATYVEQGRKLLDQGQTNSALTDFLRALDVDPGDEAAQQEIQKARAILNGAAPQGNGSAALLQQEERAATVSLGSPVDLKPLSNEPITLHMVADTKTIYQTIGKLAGINILFDPDYTSKRVPIDLNRVTLYDALRSVSFISQTFWRPITSDTIFVAQDTRQKRTEMQQQAVQTFYLSNIAAANDLNEILNAVRNLMDTTVKMQAVPSQDAIVMRGTPDQLLLAQNIIEDLDKAKPEVLIDVAVMEVSRDLLRNIGIQLPGSIGVTLQPSSAVLNSTTNTSSAVNPVTGTTGTTGQSLTLNDFSNMNATNFAISLGQATANLLLTDTSTRILQNPEVRAVDGQKADLKIGSRIPVATGSFSSGIGGVGGIGAAGISPLVSTQFQYIDVGVNMEMQPTIHYDHDITLKMKIEISSETGNVNLGGIEEPIIGQRTIEQTIRMTEGQPSLLGGILEHSETITIGGTPGLGEIPLIKYLFSSQQKEVVNDEIVFLLIPHIVRGAHLTEQNLQTIDTGTGSNVELRRVDVPTALTELQQQQTQQQTPAASTSAPVSAAQAVQQAAAQFAQNAQSLGTPIAPATPSTQPQVQPAAAQPAAKADATPGLLQLSVSPANSTQKLGGTFPLSITVGSAQDLYEVPMDVHYDPKLLTLVNVDTGDLLGKDGQTVALVHRDDGNGDVTISASRPPGVAGVNGSGSICTLTFQAKAAGDTTVAVVKAAARNSGHHILPVVGSSATVQIR